jgi:hypothetical protein
MMNRKEEPGRFELNSVHFDKARGKKRNTTL